MSSELERLHERVQFLHVRAASNVTELNSNRQVQRPFEEVEPKLGVDCDDVVEIGWAQRVSDDHRAKLSYANAWFESINALLEQAESERRYYFFFIGPTDVAPFFDAVCAGSHAQFMSTLQSKLAEQQPVSREGG